MTAPPAGRGYGGVATPHNCFAYDATSGVVPVNSGPYDNFDPDPASGTVSGGIWSLDYNNGDFQIVQDDPRRMAWTELRATRSGGATGGPGSSAALDLYNDPTDMTAALQVSNFGGAGTHLARYYILTGAVYTITIPNYKIVQVVAADFHSAFHQFEVLLDDNNDQSLYVDGVLTDFRHAYPRVHAVLPNRTYEVAGMFWVWGSADCKGAAFANHYNAVIPTPPPAPPVFSNIHLGATGLTVDFDDVAHYAVQLTGTQIAHHNALGRGM